jgi:hypothetical protein
MMRILHKRIGAATTPSGDGADASFLRFTVSRCTTDAYCHPLPCPKAWLFSYVVDTTTTSDFLIPTGNVGRIQELQVALYFEGCSFRMA